MDIGVCAQSVKIFALDVNAHQKASITEEVWNREAIKTS